MVLDLACHNLVPTLSLLNHRNIAYSLVCCQCWPIDETFLHYVRDCNHSRHIWQPLGFNKLMFLTNNVTHDLLKNGLMGLLSFLFAATVWWAWRNRNMTCLGNDTGMLFNFPSTSKVWSTHSKPLTLWSQTTLWMIILIWSSGTTTTILKSFLRKDRGFYLSGFSRYIHYTSNILYAKVYAICQGL